MEGKGNIDLFSTYRELKKMGHTPAMMLREDEKSHAEGVHAIFPHPMKAFLSLPLLVAKASRIITQEKPDVIIAEGGWYIPLLLRLANRHTPVVYVFRGLVLEVLEAFHAKSFVVKMAAKLFIKINYGIFKKSRYLLGTNPSLCKFYEEKLGKNVELVGTHLIDLGQFRPAGEPEKSGTRNRFSITGGVAVLYSGAIEEWHLPNLTDLAESMADLAKEADVQLVIMGWGRYKQHFIAHLEEIHQRSPEFSFVVLPFLQHEDVPKVIAACDICVDPLLRPYPMDYAPAGKLIEYMACGTCTITTKGHSNEELVKNRENGMIVDGTPAGLYSALKEVVTDRTLATSLGARARETIVTYFTSINRTDQLEGYLRKVLQDR